MLGKSHATMKRLRALRRDAARRTTEGVFVAEGLHLAGDALDCGAPVEMVIVSPRLASTAEGRQLRQRVEERGLALSETSDAGLESIQDARSPQPILMLIRRINRSLADCLSESGKNPLLLVAHGVQDPGNLGSLLRTAEAAGAGAFFTTPGAADLFHPRAVRASMGSILRLPALGVELDTLLPELRRRGVALAGTDPRAGKAYGECDLSGPLALFFGAEGKGLPVELAGALDTVIRIPLAPGVESLSVGAAAAVVLFEAARQRTGTSPNRGDG